MHCQFDIPKSNFILYCISRIIDSYPHFTRPIAMYLYKIQKVDFAKLKVQVRSYELLHTAYIL